MLCKFLDPKNDLAFKRIFGTERNKNILIHFLNDIFADNIKPIEEVTFLKTVQDPETAAQRTSVVDILCKDIEGRKFIIEKQQLVAIGQMKEAEEEGREEGRKEGKEEVAKNMYAKGIGIETISTLTGLTREEIEMVIPSGRSVN